MLCTNEKGEICEDIANWGKPKPKRFLVCDCPSRNIKFTKELQKICEKYNFYVAHFHWECKKCRKSGITI